jgi:hypothetical protein
MNARLDAVSIDIQSNTGVLSTDTPTSTIPLESRDEAIATKTMSAQATAPIQTTSTMLWQIATAFSTGLALLFALLWRRACKKPSLIMVNEPTTFHSTKTDALMQLKTACAKKDLFAIKSAVIEWAKIEFPNQAIHSLSNMQHCIHNKELQEKLRQLEKALYGSAQADANWNDIYTMIDAGYKNKSEANTPLPSLYPNN